MFKLGENINHLMLALIIGIFTISVSYIGDIAKNIQSMAISIQDLNIRMSQVSDSLKDHEYRIRTVENKQKQGR
jgi:outer membrane lipoprotein-sorting protein